MKVTQISKGPILGIVLLLTVLFAVPGCQRSYEKKISTPIVAVPAPTKADANTNSVNRTTDNELLPSKYIACSCGCCGGTKPVKKCLYHSKGDDLWKIIEADRKEARSKQCALVGCTIGVEYRYCD